MGLINLSTNLKSLPYGRDRFGGGSSNQPYITTPIPDAYTPGSYDFILRQGVLQGVNLTDLPGAVGIIRQISNITNSETLTTDALRISKFLTDPTNPAGQLFITKQTLLERQSVKIPGGFGRFYNPAHTIAQINNISYGVHLNKQGIDGTNLSYAQGGLFGYYNFTLRND